MRPKGRTVFFTFVLAWCAGTATYAQVEDLLDRLLGRGRGHIDNVDVDDDDPAVVELEVRFRDVEDFEGSHLTARVLDSDLRRIREFSIDPVALEAAEGTAALELRYTGAKPIRSSAIEVRIEDDRGRALTTSIVPMLHRWAGTGSAADDGDTGGPSHLADDPDDRSDDGDDRGTGSATPGTRDPAVIVINPIPIGDTAAATAPVPPPAPPPPAPPAPPPPPTGGGGVVRPPRGVDVEVRDHRGVRGAGVPPRDASAGGATVRDHRTGDAVVRDHRRSDAARAADAPITVGRVTTALVVAPQYAYAWASSPLAASYAASAEYASNPTGGGTRIERSGTGDYRVVFEGLTPPSDGSVQVVSYGGGAVRCQPTTWAGAGGGFEVYVSCANFAGTAVDSPFTVLTAWSPSLGRFGWIAADQPTQASYVATAGRSWNAGGGEVRVDRSGPGAYAVRFTGLGGQGHGGNVQVVAYGGGPTACTVASWDSLGTDFTAHVRCFDTTGTYVDALFSLLATASGEGDQVGYVWGGTPGAPDYTPPDTYARAPGGAPRITRSSTGTYLVRFPGLVGGGGGSVQVTSYGGDPSGCAVVRWNQSGADFETSVTCFDAGGRLADHAFSLLVVR